MCIYICTNHLNRNTTDSTHFMESIAEDEGIVMSEEETEEEIRERIMLQQQLTKVQRQKTKAYCNICFQSKFDNICFLPCNHNLMCYECVKKLLIITKSKLCPFCNHDIMSFK